MAVALKHFISQIVESGVFSAAEIDEFQQSQTAAAETAEDLAKQLVEQKKLTKYQSQLINQGKGDRLVLGSYVILNVIGVGGMGQVFLAEHRRMKRRVALKTLPTEMADDEQAIRRFHREVQAAAKLTHPNIVTAFDADEDKGIHYFAMEYVSGIDLADNVRSHGVLSVSRAVDYILQAAQGLEYAHSKGVIHRDIKPANMLLDHEGTIKILDMGLARVDNAADEQAATALTQAGNMMGTVDYMAPEQARDSHTADARSDIYSLGCTLHYLLAGESVYGGDTFVNRVLAHRDHPIPSLTAKLGHVPASLDAVFQKMVAKESADRYQTVGDVIRDIQACGLLDQSDSPATVRTEPADPALADFLNNQTEDVTRTLVMADEKPPVPNGSDTLQSGFLDNTLSGGVPEIHRRSRKGIGKRVWIATSFAFVAVLVLVGIFLNRGTPHGTLILKGDRPELASAVVSVDGQQQLTIKTVESIEPILIAADERQHTLTVTKDGYATFTKEIMVQAGERQTIKVRLVPTKVEENETVLPVRYTGENYALAFDGKPGWVGVKDGWKVDTVPPLTYEATVRLLSFSQDGATHIMGWGGSVDVLLHQNSNDKLTVHWYKSSDEVIRLNTETGITEETPFTFAVVWDGSTVALYVNGKKQPDIIQVAALRSGQSFFIGGQHPPTIHGIIDEVRVSNIARYTQDYTPVNRFETDKHTLALYHCDEGNWDVLNDSSGNNRHGKITGAKWVQVDDELRVIDAPTTITYPQRRAAETVLQRGGSVTIDTATARKTVTQTDRLPPEQFVLYSVSLANGSELSDADWQAFDGIKQLDSFVQFESPISENGLKQLRQLGNFDHLNLSYIELTDSGVEVLADIVEIRALSLGGNSALTNAAFDSISKMSSLRELHVSPTSVSAAGLKSLAGLPRLQSLSISHSTGLQGSALAELQPLQTLQVLELIGTDVDDAAVPSLAQLKSLRLLDLVKTKVSDEAAVRLQSLLPKCSVIHAGVATNVADRRAAQWVVETGGIVRINTTTGTGHETLTEKVLPNGPFAVATVRLKENTIATAGLKNLEGLRSIRALVLPTLKNADSELASLKDLTSLRELHIHSPELSAAGLAHLKSMSHLEQLNLGGCESLADDAGAVLTSFKHLRYLSLSQTSITEDGLKQISQLPNLHTLDLSFCPNLSASGLQHVASMPKLSTLRLNNTPISDEAIQFLQQTKNLRVLYLNRTQITAAAAAKLQAALPDCVVFHESLNSVPMRAAPKQPVVTTTDPQRRAAEMLLARGESFSIFPAAGGSQQIASRQQLPKERFALYTLNLSRGNPLSAAEWKAFEGVKSLVRLQLPDTPMSDAGFHQLQNIGSIRHLSLANSRLTDAGTVMVSELTDLRDLDLANNPGITDKSCDALLNLTELRELQISGTSITGVGLKRLSQLPDLWSLQLSLSDGIVAADLAELSSLRSLDSVFLWNSGVNDDAVESLAKLKSLRVIGLFETSMSREGVARLQRLLPNCSILHSSSSTASGDLKAAEWVVEKGGTLRIYGGPFVPHRKTPPEPFALKYIELTGPNPPGSGFIHIEETRCLDTLNWFKLSNADSELASIGKLTTLRKLNLSMSDVTAAGLSHLKKLSHLENLTLAGCRQLPDDALVHLSANRLLRHLVLNQTPVTDKGLVHLSQVSNLWDLRLESCPNITGTGLAALVTPLKLRRLSFIDSPITDEAIPHLQQMKSLRVLNLTRTQVTAAEAAKLQAALPDCVVFHESLANVPWRARVKE